MSWNIAGLGSLLVVSGALSSMSSRWFAASPYTDNDESITRCGVPGTLDTDSAVSTSTWR